MPPPPVPFFRGRQITASESDGLLVLRPRPGHEFREPPGTSALYLPVSRMIAAEVHQDDESEHSAVLFRGEFNRVDRGVLVVLAPLADDEADALVQALAGRYGLPRTPRACAAGELPATPWNEYVEAVGTYAPGHFEAADFEGVMLVCHRDVGVTLAPGTRYRVAGFVDPGARPGSLVVGYRGASLRALHVRPE